MMYRKNDKFSSEQRIDYIAVGHTSEELARPPEELVPAQDPCPHRKPNQCTALAGQKLPNGDYVYVCLCCGKDFLASQMSDKDKFLIPAANMVGGRIIADSEILELLTNARDFGRIQMQETPDPAEELSLDQLERKITVAFYATKSIRPVKKFWLALSRAWRTFRACLRMADIV